MGKIGVRRLSLKLNGISDDTIQRIKRALEDELETNKSKPVRLELTFEITFLKHCINERKEVA